MIVIELFDILFDSLINNLMELTYVSVGFAGCQDCVGISYYMVCKLCITRMGNTVMGYW